MIALQHAVAAAAPAAIASWQAQRAEERAPGKFLAGLITRYLDSAEYAGLAASTRAEYRNKLDFVRAHLGEMEVRALESRRARATLLEWRDRFKATPKTADARLAALSLVLQWAEDRGEATNPLKDFPRIYTNRRADVIWRPHELALLLSHCEPAFARVVRFAALTGMRQGDITAVTRAAIGDSAIVWKTGKSRGRRTVILPITAQLRALLEELPANDAVTILTNSHGQPWSQEGIKSAMARAKARALAQARKLHGDEAKSGIEHLRFHDLRGTAVTNFIDAGLTLEDTATIVGWERERVRQIAEYYVTPEAIGLAIVRRLENKR